MSDFYNERKIKARKEHKCFFCKKPIFIGEEYIYSASVYEGDFATIKSHDDCHELLKVALKEYSDNEYDDDTVRHFLSDYICYACDKEESCNRDCIYECGRKLILEKKHD